MCKLNLLGHLPSREVIQQKNFALTRSKLTLAYKWSELMEQIFKTPFSEAFWVFQWSHGHPTCYFAIQAHFDDTVTADIAWVPVCLGDEGFAYPSNRFPQLIFIVIPLGEETVKWQALLLQRQADCSWAIIGAKLPSQCHNKNAPHEMPKQTWNSGKGNNLCSTLNDDEQHIVHIHTNTFWKPKAKLSCVLATYLAL